MIVQGRRFAGLRGILAWGVACAASLALAGCAAWLGSEREHDIGRSDGDLTFEEFLERAYLEPWEGGVWIVDGDTPVTSWKGLRDIYERIEQPGRLIVDRSGGRDAAWTVEHRRDLTYCVSTSFGARYEQVVRAMREAAAAWEAAADVRFRHVPSEDSRCDASNTGVLFDVRPTSGAGYLARAFFPGNPRQWRNVIVDQSCFSTRAPLTCTGVLRHELGHVLGFRHEHTRPEAGRCFEDSAWRPLTPYDRESVMHYPQCGGRNATLDLSAHDIAGVRALYGPPRGDGGSGEPSSPPPGVDRHESYEGSLARGERRRYGPYEIAAGARFRATLTGAGDADLYVRFGAPPSESEWDCRPYREDSNETCELDAPAESAAWIWVEVRGYTDASYYRLAVSWRSTDAAASPPPGPGMPPAGGTERIGRGSGSLRRGALQYFAPLTVFPGSTLAVDVSGSGDPDLYVRWNEQPTIERFDCRSATRSSASERCVITVPGTAVRAHVMVHAWDETTFWLQARWTAP